MIDLALLLSFVIIFPKYRIYKHLKKSIVFYLSMNGVDSPDVVLKKYLVLRRLKGSFLTKVINTVIKMLALLIAFIFFLECSIQRFLNLLIQLFCMNIMLYMATVAIV